MLVLKGKHLPCHSSGENEGTVVQGWDLNGLSDTILFIIKSLESHIIVQYFTSFSVSAADT